jgi:hypothetical protein
MLRRSVVFLSFFCFLTVFSAITFAQAPPSADTYVTTAMPMANFGSSSILPVQAGTTSFVQLNLGGFPANARIAKATLRLYVDAVAAPGSFDVYAVNGRWSERGLTAINAPVLGASATGGQSIVVTKSSLNQFVLVDITSLVQGWLDGSITNHGVALALTSSEGSFAFDSKESRGHHPELEVVLADATPLALSAAGGSEAATTASNRTSAVVAANGAQPPPSSPYINNTTTQQTGASFNIDGNGTAAIFNATSQYQLAGAPVLGTNGTQSLFLGAGAGPSNTGGYNTFLGLWAGGTNTTGGGNIFVGMEAGYLNTTGGANTFLGYSAGFHNTIGTHNLFFGYASGYNNTTGSQNSFLGVNAGVSNTTGNNNFFLGVNAGYRSQSGSQNIFIGNAAGQYVSSGMNNIFLGDNAGSAAGPAASNNIYIASSGAGSDTGVVRIGDPTHQTTAYLAGIYGNSPSGAMPVVVNSSGQLGTSLQVPPGSPNYIQNGSPMPSASFTIGGVGAANNFNSAVNYQIAGSRVLGIDSPADENLFLGVGAGAHNLFGQGQFNTFSGYQAGYSNTTGAGNAFFGNSAGLDNTTGSYNTFSGYQAGFSNTTGSSNTFSGYGAGVRNTTGSSNAFFGYSAGENNTTGTGNAFFGNSAGLFNTTGAGNAFFGSQAGFSNTTGTGNAFFGVGAGSANTTGGQNTFSGAGVGQHNTIGARNTFTGWQAGAFNATGTDNAFFGLNAGFNNKTGSGNTFVGTSAGLYSGLNNADSYNTHYGFNAGSTATTGSNNIYLGSVGMACPIGPCTENSTIRIGGDIGYGSAQTAAYIAGIYGATSAGGVPVYINSNWQLGTLTSSRRFKEQIHAMGDSSSGLMKLRPVTFLYKPEYDKGPRTLQYGLIAEEVAEVYPDLVAYEADGKPYTVKYQYLTPMLLNELQKQNAVLSAQQEIIEKLQAQNDEMQQRLIRLEKLLVQSAH